MDFLDEEFEEVINIFREESEDHIQKLNQNLLKLEADPQNKAVISELFREAHSLKGAASMIGLNDVQALAHKLEDAFGLAKDNSLNINAESTDILCKAVDCISSIIDQSIQYKDSFHSDEVDIILKQLENIVNSYNKNTAVQTNSIDITDVSHIYNRAGKNTLESKLDYISNNILNISPENIQLINQITENLEEIIYSSNQEKIKKIFQEILKFINLVKDKKVSLSNENINLVKQSFDTAYLMTLLPESSIEDPDKVIQDLDNIYKILPPINLQKDLIFNNANMIGIYNPIESSAIKTLRVDTKKLDQLVNQVGELIIGKIKSKEHLSEIEKTVNFIEDWYREWNKIKRFLKHNDKKSLRFNEIPLNNSGYIKNKNIYSFFEEGSLKLADLMSKMNSIYKTIHEDDTRLNLIVNELEEGIKSVRVLPLATIFHMFPRMVRDIAREKEKNIELVISGSETSVDKKIIEEIKAPLTHIIRNAIDHGIEQPDIRIKNGKNPTGKIFLTACHLENSVLIEVIDDGKGIDIETIKRKVLEKGLLTTKELQAMTDEQIMNIIFWTGFSTDDVVSNISGRGIGLDIAYTKISQLNGKINIKSILGEGCRVSIKLPVTMATIKSFLVKVNNQTFAIPTSVINTTILINHDDIFYKEGKEEIVINNEIIPICKLSKVLEMPDKKTDENNKIIVIVIQSEDTKIGIVVDKLIGDQEILHKNLSLPLIRVRNIAGVTILGSGELCLILNISDLIKSAYLSLGFVKHNYVVKNISSKSLIQRSIMIIDDSVTTRILERNILRSAGYNVIVAINGLDALNKLNTEKVDLIITDIEMPEINGFELISNIKKDEKLKNIPVIILTSMISEEGKRKGLSLGANVYITKNKFDQDEFIQSIEKLLSM